MDRRAFLSVAALAPFAPAFAAGSTGRIRVGQIGTSHAHASGKMDSVRSLGDLYEVVGVAEPIAGRQAAAKGAKAYAGLRWMSEADLLADASVEAVLVETTLADSARAAMAAIAAGKHVHLDKPGAERHDDFRRMRLEAERRGLTVQMGYMLRHNPAFALLLRTHREGWLGDITEIDASMGKLADARVMAQLGVLPGHGMFELACHLVDIVVKLLGAPSSVRYLGKRTGLLAADFPDNQLAVLEYPRATVTLRCNHGDPFGGPHRRFRVAGTKGAMVIDPLESGKGVLRLSEDVRSKVCETVDGKSVMKLVTEFRKGDNPFALKAPGGRYDEEFRHLHAVLRAGVPFGWDAAHDIAVHATALRCAGLEP
ncbi:MAG: Gfo/Idh/MocA family protein [Opitutales bacterium]